MKPPTPTSILANDAVPEDSDQAGASTTLHPDVSSIPLLLNSAVPVDVSDTANDTALDFLRGNHKLIAIGKLTAEIAHEIANPLESIGNLLYLAQHEPGMPVRAAEYLRTAERELARVVQISKQTLSFSRESAVPVTISVTSLMDEVLNLYNRRILQKRLAVIREYATDAEIVALPGEIRQVISNLVSNAIEALAAEGTMRLRVRAAVQHKSSAATDGIRISIGDNGAGIAEPVRARLGRMFFTTKGEAGTGLGLWVTGAIVARHQGTMRVRSATGKRQGTVFSVFLPLTPVVSETPDDRPAGKVTEISRHPRYASHPHEEPSMRRRG